MATHSSTFAWKIPWTEEPGKLQSMGSWRVGHDWATSLSLFTFMHWRRKWQPTPVFLPGESHGQRSLVGYSPWGCKRVRLDWVTKQQQKCNKTWILPFHSFRNMLWKASFHRQRVAFLLCAFLTGWNFRRNISITAIYRFRSILQIKYFPPNFNFYSVWKYAWERYPHPKVYQFQ